MGQDDDWDEPEAPEECIHDDYDADILTGLATCAICGRRWMQTIEERNREREALSAYDKMCEVWNSEERQPDTRLPSPFTDDDVPF